MNAPPVPRRVLITGCSSGIGRASARVLRDRGWLVVPTARTDTDLEALRSEGFDPIRMELADSESVRRGADAALERMGGEPGALVNNAAYAQGGALEDVTRDVLRAQFEANVFGMQELTNRFVPVFRKQGHGRVVHISSVYGRVSMPMVGSYCATKFAMEALADAQRVELRHSGIAVSLIEPGPILSRFRINAAEVSRKTIDLEQSRFGPSYKKEIQRRLGEDKKADFFRRPPEAVAEKIRHALESPRPRRRYCVTPPAYLGAFAARFFPTAWLDALAAKSLPSGS